LQTPQFIPHGAIRFLLIRFSMLRSPSLIHGPVVLRHAGPCPTGRLVPSLSASKSGSQSLIDTESDPDSDIDPDAPWLCLQQAK